MFSRIASRSASRPTSYGSRSRCPPRPLGPKREQRAYSNSSSVTDLVIKTVGYGTSVSVAVASAFALYGYHSYKVADPDQYLIKTGLGIKDISVSKQGFIWPFQKHKFITMHPQNYKFSIQSMSTEKIPFTLPGVFTIAPKDTPESLTMYVRKFENIGQDNNSKMKESVVSGIIEGETRISSAQMTMDEIFKDRQKLKETIIKNVQEELDKIGLEVLNFNMSEIEDSKDSEIKYFHNKSQTKLSEVKSTATIDVSKAKKDGDIGRANNEAETRKKVAEFEAITVLLENEKQKEIVNSQAELEVTRVLAQRDVKSAEVKASQEIEKLNTDLQKEVEQKRIAMKTEELRAKELSVAQVNTESRIKEAEGEAAAIRLRADANLHAQVAAATGVQALLEAQAIGLAKVLDSFHGDNEAFLKYYMAEKDIYTKLARESARAVEGMKPEIKYINMGPSTGNPMSEIMKFVPLALDAIGRQTGIKLTNPELPNFKDPKDPKSPNPLS
jgi:flotillin